MSAMAKQNAAVLETYEELEYGEEAKVINNCLDNCNIVLLSLFRCIIVK